MLCCRRRIIGSRLNFETVVSQGIKLTNCLLFVILLCLVMVKIKLRKIISMPRVEGVVDGKEGKLDKEKDRLKDGFVGIPAVAVVV